MDMNNDNGRDEQTTNTIIQKKMSEIIKINSNIVIDSVSNSPCTSSIDYLSSDEGYVGSYREKHSNKNKKNNKNLLLKNKILAQQQQQQQQETLITTTKIEYYDDQYTEEFDDDDKYTDTSSGSGSSASSGTDELLDYEIDYDLKQLPFYIQELNFDYYSNSKLYDYYLNDDNLIDDEFVYHENNTSNNGIDYIDDDYIDMCAYLYEIDLNIDYYYLNDYLLYDDYDVDNMLKFTNVYESCNMRMYEESLREYYEYLRIYEENICLTSDMYAYVDCIPEFVPGMINYESCNDDLDQTLCGVSGGGGGMDGVGDGDYSTTNGCDIFDNVYNVYMGDTMDTNSEIDIDQQSTRSLIPMYHQSSTTTTTTATSRKPCVYMLNDGQCLRADCRFAHDLHNITCKYWLEGECLKGDMCEFLHDFGQNQSLASSATTNMSDSNSSLNFHYSSKIKKSQHSNSNGPTKIKDFNLNTQDFPELSVSSTNNTQKMLDDANQSSNENDSLVNQKTKKKSRKFKDNILVSLSLPALTNSNKKKHIN